MIIIEAYLDNAATTRMTNATIELMDDINRNTYGNPSSMHKKGFDAKHAIDAARLEIAKAINAEPCEIYFTSGGTESMNLAIRSGLLYCTGDKHSAVATQIEHASALHNMERISGIVDVTYVAPDKNGVVDIEQIKDYITEDTGMVVVMLANNELGTINNVSEIAKLCHEKGAILVCDAVQAVGHIPVDVKELGIDMLTMSAHKFHGPKGVGALYVRDGIEISPIELGGGQENGVRSGTENVAGICGMAHALKEELTDIDAKMKEVATCRDFFLASLMITVPGTKSNTKSKNRLPGIINCQFPGINNEDFILQLSMRGVYASAGSACQSNRSELSNGSELSHVLKAIGLTEEEINNSVRFSIDSYTTRDEIDYAITQIIETVASMKDADS